MPSLLVKWLGISGLVCGAYGSVTAVVLIVTRGIVHFSPFLYHGPAFLGMLLFWLGAVLLPPVIIVGSLGFLQRKPWGYRLLRGSMCLWGVYLVLGLGMDMYWTFFTKAFDRQSVWLHVTDSSERVFYQLFYCAVVLACSHLSSVKSLFTEKSAQ